MAKQVRQTHIVFGSAGVVSAPTQFAEFGSLAGGSPIRTTDIATIQALPAWTAGFQSAIYASNKAILLNDLNSWCYEHSFQVGQIFQDGIPQWDAGTTYQPGSWVQDAAGLGQAFQCLLADTLGTALPVGASSAAWLWVNPPLAVVSGAPAAGKYLKTTGASAIGPAGSYALATSLLSEDGTNVVIGGSAGVNGLKFPDNSVQTKAAAPVTAQAVVTGSRAAAVNYQNTGTKPLFVSISCGVNGGDATAYCDASATPSTVVVATSGSGAAPDTVQLFFIVLPGYYYRLELTGSSTKTLWVEYS